MAMAAAAGSIPRREVHVIGLISSAHFLSHFYVISLAPLYPLIRPEIGASWSGIGMAITAFAVGTGVLQPPMGFVVDRYGGRVVLICGLALLAAAIGMVGFVTSLWQLVALMAIAGIGNSVFHPADYSIISGAVSEPSLGRAFALHSFGGNAGIVTGPLVMIALQSGMGWRTAVIGVGIVGVVLALVLLALSRMIGHGGARRKPQTGGAWRELLTSRPLIAMFFFYIGASAANTGVAQFSVAAFGQIYGISLTTATIALTVYQASTLAMVLPGGWLADRTGRHDVIMIGCYSGAALFTVLAGIGIMPFWLVIPVLGIAGAGRGLINAARDVSVRHVSTDQSVGTVFAFVSTGFLIGQAIGPPIYGALLDLGSPEIVFWTSGAFTMAAVATVFISKVGRNEGTG